MSDGQFRQAGQSDSRKGSAGDHDIAGDPIELVVSGFEVGAKNERWQPSDAFADVAQAWIGGADAGNKGPAAHNLFVNQEGAKRVFGIPAGLGRNH